MVALLILGVAAVAMAAPCVGMGSGRSSITQLDLTDEQYSKLQELHKEYYEERQALMSQMRDINFNLKNMYLQKDPDEKAIEAQQKKAEKLKQQIIQLREKQRNNVSEILTKEQQEKLEELRGPSMGRGVGSGNRRGGFGQGVCKCQGEGRGMGRMGRF